MSLETSFAPLLDVLLKSVALLLAGAALLAAMRKASAANRHAVAMAIFAALLLLPLTKLLVPRWSLAMEAASTPMAQADLAPVIFIETSASTTSPVSSNAGAPSHRSAAMVIPWSTLFVGLWLGGAVLLMVRRASIVWRLGTLAQSSEPIEDEQLAAWARKCMEASGVHAPVRESAASRVPLVVGILRPIILLPMNAREWGEARVAFALRHELGHIRRRDCLTRLLAEIACAIYWLNPLVWLAARQLRLAQEQACDDLVLNAGAPAEEYAGQLVDAVRSLQADHLGTHHALAMAQPSTLETRVVAIMEPTRNRSALSAGGALGGGALAVALLSVCSVAQLRGAPDPQSVSPAAEAPKAGSTQAAQVAIDAWFLEVSTEPTGLADLVAAIEKGKGPASLPPEEELRKKGVTTLARPRVLTPSGQKATIAIGREYRYPTDWEKDPTTAVWKSKSIGTQHLGASLEVTPTVTAAGTIELDLTSAVNDLFDVVDLEAPQPDAKRDPARIVPDGHRSQPVFKHYPRKERVTLSPGKSEMVPMPQVFGSMAQAALYDLRKDLPQDPGLPDADKPSRGHLMFLVTARVVPPGSLPAVPPKAGSPAPSPEKAPDQPANAPAKESDPLLKKSGATGDRLLMDVTADSIHAGSDGGFQASGNVTIDSGGYIIKTDAVQVTRKPKDAPAAAPGSAPNGSAKAAWIIPMVDFREASVREIAEFLVHKSAALDPTGKSTNIVVKDGPGLDKARVTLKLDNVTLDTVLMYVAGLANAEVVKEEFAYVLQAKAAPGGAAAPAAPNAEVKPAPATGADMKGSAWKKAETITIPRLDFREASVEESIDFLRAKARQLDPDKQGVNLVIQPALGEKPPKISISLTNIPLAEALRYVANLAGYEIVAGDAAILFKPIVR